MLNQLFRVFSLGASLGDKLKIACFYVILFVKRRIGFGSTFAHPWCVHIRFEGKVYEFYLAALLDIHILREMFVDEHYRMPSDESVQRVIDLGSNIGGSLVYFAHKFPHARIIAVEPHPFCLHLLRLNAKQFGDRVEVVAAAVCAEAGEVTLYPNGEHWSASVIHRRGDSSGFAVTCMTLRDVLGRFGGEEVDLMKCDIEGAEFDVFTPQETSRIRRFIGEVHPTVAKRSVAEFVALFPRHHLIREDAVGEHVHVELVIE